MRRLPPLVLGLLLAALAAGCGQEDSGLIPEQRASQLTAAVDRVGQACGDEDPDAARAAVDEANRLVSELPRRVNRRLRSNLREWLEHIGGRVERDCEPAPEETPTPTETPEPTPEPTETPTPTETPEPTPEPTEEPPGEGPDGEGPPGQQDGGVEPPGDGGVTAPGDEG